MKNGDRRQPQQMMSGHDGAVASAGGHSPTCPDDFHAAGASDSNGRVSENAPLKIFIPTTRIFAPTSEKRKRYNSNDSSVMKMTPYDNKRLYENTSVNQTVAELNRPYLCQFFGVNNTVGWPPNTVEKMLTTAFDCQNQPSEAEYSLSDETDEIIVAVAKFMAAYPNSDPLEVYQLLLFATSRRPATQNCGAVPKVQPQQLSESSGPSTSISSSISVIKPTFMSIDQASANGDELTPFAQRVSPKPPSRNVIRHGAEYSVLGSMLEPIGLSNSAFCRVSASASTSRQADGYKTAPDYSSYDDPIPAIKRADILVDDNSQTRTLANVLTSNYAANSNLQNSQNRVLNCTTISNNFGNNSQQQQPEKQQEESMLSALLSATTTRKSPYVPESRTEIQSGLAGLGPFVSTQPNPPAEFSHPFINDSRAKLHATANPYYRPDYSLTHLEPSDSPPKPYHPHLFGDFSTISCSSTSAYSSSRYSGSSPSANGGRSGSDSDRSSRPSASPHGSAADPRDGRPLPADGIDGDGKPNTERYKDRRRRNNEAAKRCRANRRAIFEFRSRRVAQLERENVELRAQMARLRAELERFQTIASLNNNNNNNSAVLSQL